MITPLTITSLDQGKELARRQVERLYVERAEPAPEVAVEAVEVTETAVQVPHRKRRFLVAQFLSFWDATLPIGAWRL